MECSGDQILDCLPRGAEFRSGKCVNSGHLVHTEFTCCIASKLAVQLRYCGGLTQQSVITLQHRHLSYVYGIM